MQLAAYLEVNRLSASEFARISGVGPRQVVHNYLKGLRFPTPENLLRIRRATNGAVTADDFVDQHTQASDAGDAAPAEAA